MALEVDVAHAQHAYQQRRYSAAAALALLRLGLEPDAFIAARCVGSGAVRCRVPLAACRMPLA